MLLRIVCVFAVSVELRLLDQWHGGVQKAFSLLDGMPILDPQKEISISGYRDFSAKFACEGESRTVSLPKTNHHSHHSMFEQEIEYIRMHHG